VAGLVSAGLPCLWGVVEKKRLTISTLSIKLLQMFTDLFNAIAFANASTAGQVTSTQQMMEML
jgi:hypothetical protein